MNLKGLKALAIFMLAFQALAAAQHFSFTVTSNNMTVILPDGVVPTIDGGAIQIGDEIGAFKPNGTCVGATVWAGVATSVAVMGLDTAPTPLPGMAVGEEVHWKLWDASLNQEFDAVPAYSMGDGLYSPNDLEFLSSLAAISVTNYTLTMAVSPGGSGTTSPAIGPHDYAPNTVVNISATPAGGYRFVNWTSTGGAVANPTSSATTVTVEASKTVTAHFELIPFTLTMAVSPGGSGTTVPAVGPHDYAPNTVVDISATPAGGYRFVNWTSTGGAVGNPTSPSTTVTVEASKTVTAHFELIPFTLTMAVTPGSGTTVPAAGPHDYAPNTVVNISATPAGGYRFVNWTSTGGAVANPTSSSTTVTVEASKTVTAHFELIPFTLTMAVSPGGAARPCRPQGRTIMRPTPWLTSAPRRRGDIALSTGPARAERWPIRPVPRPRSWWRRARQ